MKSSSLTIQDAGQADQAEAWLLLLPQWRPEDLPDQAEVEATVAALTEPADPRWIMARIAALLLPYYEKETPQSVRVMEAEDWLAALDGYPQWAIDRAVRWWKGPENKNRHKRPLEGDIADKVRVLTGNVLAVPKLLNRKRVSNYERREERCITAEDRKRRREFVKSIGLRVYGEEE